MCIFWFFKHKLLYTLGWLEKIFFYQHHAIGKKLSATIHKHSPLPRKKLWIQAKSQSSSSALKCSILVHINKLTPYFVLILIQIFSFFFFMCIKSHFCLYSSGVAKYWYIKNTLFPMTESKVVTLNVWSKQQLNNLSNLS